MHPRPHTRLRIGAFVVDPLLDEVSGAGTRTKLEPRATDVLVYLAQRPGEVVSVDDLRAQVWSGVIVTPDSVYRAINAIRRALGDDPRAPQYVANVPRRGYRLIAPVAAIATAPEGCLLAEASPAEPSPVDLLPAAPIASDEPRTALRARSRLGLAAVGTLVVSLGLLGAGAWLLRAVSSPPTAPATLGDKSIAVLPFVDMSAAHDQGYFVDGLTEEVLDQLTRVPGLQVIARTSSFSFRGSSADVPTIARRLNVAHVLEGSVRRSGDHLRITTQLIRADTGTHLWSETYERELRDVFEVQDEIAAAVVAALRLQLLPSQHAVGAPRTMSMVAYNEYLLGREFQNRGTAEGYRQAADAYRRAIALDAGYAPAYAGLALADIVVADENGTTRARLGPALAAADRAITLGPERADGYSARGYLRYAYVWDWQGAQADFYKALAREPSDSTHWRRYADLLASTGRLHEAIAAGRKATALDPLSAPGWGNLGMYLAALGDYPEAERALRRALELVPDSPFALNGYATLKLLEGRSEEALQIYQHISLDGFRLTGTAMAEHSLAHVRESQRALERALRMPDGWAYEIAETYAWRGESEQALEWLERACSQRDPGIATILADPLLRGVRTGSRYAALVQRMRLLRVADGGISEAAPLSVANWPADAAPKTAHTPGSTAPH